MIIPVSTAVIVCSHSLHTYYTKNAAINNGPEQVECTDATLHLQGYITHLQQDH